ncbi:MAG: ATP-binding protein [Anaerolineales bacterium]
MEENARHQFQIDLPGLLKVLAEGLYASKTVAVRELLQNAHDSCVRRSVEGSEAHYHPRLDVFSDSTRRVLTFQDNGSGLTAEEATEYLSTIGRSYTRELTEKLAVLSPAEAAQLIGQFGLGFLSAFLIASEVTFTTLSMRAGSQAVRWRSSGDVHYELTPVSRPAAGTTVELQLKPSAAFLLNEDILIETIQQYADFLPIPIHVNHSTLPVNLMTPPWESPQPAQHLLDYISRTFRHPTALGIIPLTDQVMDLGHDTITMPLRGFLFIPPSSQVSVQEYGDLTVYIRRMFICANQRQLLPAWAKFVRGVIDCPYLQPTASREDLQQDDNFVAVQQALAAQLTAGLRQIAQTDPPAWKTIVRSHADLIINWVVQDDDLFDHLADLVLLQTSRGPQTLPEYLELTHGVIYYVAHDLGSLQEQVLGEARGMPVVEALWIGVAPFLKKYAQWRPNVRLIQLDGEAQALLRPVLEAPFEALLTDYRARGLNVRVASYKPEAIPALMLYSKEAEFRRDSRQALERGELPGPFAGLVSQYLDRTSSVDEDPNGTLYLNAACPLIQRLAQQPLAAAEQQAVLSLLYQIARLFAGRMLTPGEVTLAFQDISQAIQGLLA